MEKFVYLAYIVDVVEYSNCIYFDSLRVFDSEEKALSFLKKYITDHFRLIGCFDEVNIFKVCVNDSLGHDECILLISGRDFKEIYLKELCDGK